MERCIFDRDTLFTFYIMQNEDLSTKLKQLNKDEKLKPIDMMAIMDQVIGVYHYSSELPIFNLANSEYKSKHAVTQKLVILSESDFASKLIKMLFFPFDLDLAMVNQIMHTFTQQKGYLSNNITQETWSWHKDLYDLR